jgi:hypothetical protein
LLVVALWTWLFPELRDADKLTPVQEQTADTATNAQSV